MPGLVKVFNLITGNATRDAVREDVDGPVEVAFFKPLDPNAPPLILIADSEANKDASVTNVIDFIIRYVTPKAREAGIDPMGARWIEIDSMQYVDEILIDKLDGDMMLPEYTWRPFVGRQVADLREHLLEAYGHDIGNAYEGVPQARIGMR